MNWLCKVGLHHWGVDKPPGMNIFMEGEWRALIKFQRCERCQKRRIRA